MSKHQLTRAEVLRWLLIKHKRKESTHPHIPSSLLLPPPFILPATFVLRRFDVPNPIPWPISLVLIPPSVHVSRPRTLAVQSLKLHLRELVACAMIGVSLRGVLPARG